jgi:hypothetical protein
MTNEPHAELSLPGAMAVGPSSPVVRALVLVRAFLSQEPEPDLATPSAKSCGLLSGNHLCQLIDACGLLNGTGLHSAAVALLRPLEDALDCFAAVTLVEGAAERWADRNLKPSDAAKLWTVVAGDTFDLDDARLPDYRRTLRGQFAHYSHCSYDLCLWDLYFDPQTRDPKSGQLSGLYELNWSGRVINMNAHAVDAHLTAHLLEFLTILKRSYSSELERRADVSRNLARLESEIIPIMDRHNEHGCQNVLVPPEWRRGNP